MMKKNSNDLIDEFDSKFKAICHALWMKFKYRRAKLNFGVIKRLDNKWGSLEDLTAKEINIPFLDVLPKDLSEMSYDDIRAIRTDENPLKHWEEITGMISTMDGEILRYILHSKLPLEKLIRFELAERGYDENTHWVGFEKANNIWLK